MQIFINIGLIVLLSSQCYIHLNHTANHWYSLVVIQKSFTSPPKSDYGVPVSSATHTQRYSIPSHRKAMSGPILLQSILDEPLETRLWRLGIQRNSYTVIFYLQAGGRQCRDQYSYNHSLTSPQKHVLFVVSRPLSDVVGSHRVCASGVGRGIGLVVYGVCQLVAWSPPSLSSPLGPLFLGLPQSNLPLDTPQFLLLLSLL